MSIWHGYIGIEDINLTIDQRAQLWNTLQNIGEANMSSFPSLRNHRRLSLDKRKLIVEAAFEPSKLTIPQFKYWLGNIFSINPSSIDHTTQQTTFHTLPTNIATFGHSGVNYIRFALFAGLAATWHQSRRETVAYIQANPQEWEPHES